MPIELTEVTSGYNLSVINDNFQTIEETWDEKLDRLESAQGNSMSQDIDMNGNNILNVGAITNSDTVVEEAPEDGVQYARQNANWVEVEASGGGVGKYKGTWTRGGDGSGIGTLLNFTDGTLPTEVGSAPIDANWSFETGSLVPTTLLESPQITTGTSTFWSFDYNSVTAEYLDITYFTSIGSVDDNFIVFINGGADGAYVDNGVSTELETGTLAVPSGLNTFTITHALDAAPSAANTVGLASLRFYNESSYEVDDMVLYNGDLYICLTAATVEEPGVGSDWLNVTNNP